LSVGSGRLTADAVTARAHSKGVPMRKVVVVEYLTLDGVTEAPGPTGEFARRGWTLPDWNDELATFQSDQLFASDALLLGRVTYEEFVAAWPARSGDPFSDRMNGLPKFVASTTLDEPLAWNATRLDGDAADEVATLKRQPGQDILVYGSGTLVDTLRRHDLVDEYRFVVYPLVLGGGKRLFADGSETALRLVEGKATGPGVALLTYLPARAEAGG
jgi:dihydrofolate reductase